MSGVSITSGTVDLDAILQGGADFVARMESFKTAKQDFERALDDLNLGKGARDALDDAARQLDKAKADADGMRAEALTWVATTKADVSDWASATRGAAMQAREQADAALADAEKMQAAARSVLDDANARASAIDARIEQTKKAFRDAQAGLASKVDAL